MAARKNSSCPAAQIEPNANLDQTEVCAAALVPVDKHNEVDLGLHHTLEGGAPVRAQGRRRQAALQGGTQGGTRSTTTGGPLTRSLRVLPGVGGIAIAPFVCRSGVLGLEGRGASSLPPWDVEAWTLADDLSCAD